MVKVAGKMEALPTVKHLLGVSWTTMSAKVIRRHRGRSTHVGCKHGAGRHLGGARCVLFGICKAKEDEDGDNGQTKARRAYTRATSAPAEVDGRVVARGVSLRLLVGGDDGGGKMRLPAGSKPRGQLGAGEGEGRSGRRRWGWWRVGGPRRVWGSSSVL